MQYETIEQKVEEEKERGILGRIKYFFKTGEDPKLCAEELEKIDIYHPDSTLLAYEKSRHRIDRIGMLAIRYLWIKTKASKVNGKIFGDCPMEPHCSKYSYLSIGEHGLIKGIWYGMKRTNRCNPAEWKKTTIREGRFYDPIKSRKQNK